MFQAHRLFLFLILLSGTNVPALSAQGSPFTGTSPPAEPRVLPSIFPIPGWMRDIQRHLHSQLASLIRASREEAGALFFLILTAFLFGMFHSLLPGHQKTLVTAFYLSHDARPSSALVTGGLFTLLHTVSNMGIYGIVLLLIHLSGGTLGYGATSDIAGHWTRTIAAVGAVGLAVYLLWETWGDIQTLRGHRHHGHAGHNHPPPHQLNKNYWWMLAVAGLMPCPGTLLVLFFAFSLGAYVLGAISVLAISVGVGLVLGLLAFGAIIARRTGSKLVGGRRAEVLAVVFQILAALLILFTSIILIL